jgi:hypothetical protein
VVRSDDAIEPCAQGDATNRVPGDGDDKDYYVAKVDCSTVRECGTPDPARLPPATGWFTGETYAPHGSTVMFGLGASLCTTNHSIHTRFTNIFGTSISETTMRPNPR